MARVSEYLLLIVGVAVVLVGGGLAFVTTRVRRRTGSPTAPPRPTTPGDTSTRHGD